MLKEMLHSQMAMQGGAMDQKNLVKFAKKYARKMKF